MAALGWNLLIVVLVSAAPRIAGQDTSFFFNGFSTNDPNLQYSGDTAVTSKGHLDLTKYSTNSVGHAFYGPAIRLLDPSTSTVASFSTNFSYLIQGQYGRTGEGMAFVLLSSNTSVGNASGGAFLGVYGSDGAQVTKTLAVEFDTFKNKKVANVEIDDINANHVGLDLDVIQSKIQVDAGTVGINLADGSMITSWIDYSASTSTIEVRLSLQSAGRPINPLLSYNVDLSSVLCGSEFVWIGFSASAGDYCFEYHTIYTWGFSSWGLPPLRPPVPPPASPPRSPPAFPPPPSPSHRGPVSPPTSPPCYPPSPTPWHGRPITPPTSPPHLPPAPTPSPRGPVSPPKSPPGYIPPSPPRLPPAPTPSYRGPVSPPKSPPGYISPSPPWHGGPSPTPEPTPNSPKHYDHPVTWAVPVGVGCGLVFGVFLLFCWRRHRHRTPPPIPHHSPAHPGSPPISPYGPPPVFEVEEEVVIIEEQL